MKCQELKHLPEEANGELHIDLQYELKLCLSWIGVDICLQWAILLSTEDDDLSVLPTDLKARMAEPAAEVAMRFLRIKLIGEKEKRE